MTPDSFDLRALPDTFYRDPYPTYARLQREAPVLRLPDGGVFLTRYADLRAVYRDAKRFSSEKRTQFGPVFGEDAPLFEHHTTSLVFNDPPLHTHVRRAIGNALSSRMVEVMQRDVEVLVEGLLDGLEARSEFDLIADFAAAIPVEVIGNLLRVPRSERGPLRQWSLAILGSLEARPSAEQLERGNRSVREFLDYLEGFVAARREELSPADDDIVARLLRWEQDGFRLSGKELYHQCIFLLNAGHETTTNLIGNGAELLLRFTDARRALRSTPELIDRAVEEMLRFESPNQLGNRTATAESVIGGLRIEPGTILTLAIGAANRDPAVFERAERFEIGRDPNPHLAFAAGIHTCAGLNVARLEARVALSKLLERFPDLQLAGEAARAKRARFRGFERLPVRP